MKYLIIGGTGTLGQEILSQLSISDKVTIFSRCELKQKKMSEKFSNYPNVHYVLGDIRDYQAVVNSMYDCDTVFHVAALKHIEVMERNPIECVETNIRGTINVARAAKETSVRRVIFSSTDKAIDPINVYGQSKAISERILLNYNQQNHFANFIIYRWGNVLGSNGSFLHTIKESFDQDRAIPITSSEMTRYWINIKDCVEFMLSTYREANCHLTHIPPMKAARVLDVLMAFCKVMNYPISNLRLDEIGLRKGEKLHEQMVSGHNLNNFYPSSQFAQQYTEEELYQLVKTAAEYNGWIAKER